jgi:G:T-mismatch repair DNA endonuclease (very short patch repair protein)
MLIHHGAKRVSTNPWGWRGAGENRKAERIKKLWHGRDMWWASLSDEEKSIIMGKVCSANTIGSKLETRVAEALDRLHITYKRWVSVGTRNFDFEIDGCKTLMEVNGDFWHANPEIYTAEDVVHFPTGDKKAKLVWENDKRKRLTAERNGYRLLTIWESELKKTSDLLLEKWLVATIIV